MTLIRSTSGIRGTIKTTTNDNFTPVDVVRFTADCDSWLIEKRKGKKLLWV